MSERIARRLAHAGVASRRQAERMIAQGRVAVNGAPLTSPAFAVGPGDAVTVDGEPVGERPPLRLWRFHKPAGTVVTASDERGRKTVFELLPEDAPRMVAVGRLDLASEGLLLFTNDGALARWLELPATGWARRYRARVHGRPDADTVAALARGMTVAGVRYGPVQAKVDRQSGANAWMTLVLREGRKREIRQLLAALGLTVNRLLRTAYGPFQLGGLKRGALREVRRRTLAEQLGGRWAERLEARHRDADRRRAP